MSLKHHRFSIFPGIALALCVCFAQPASAQASKGAVLQIEMENIARKSSESVNINLSETMLKLAARFLSKDDPDEAAIGELIGGLRGVYVRRYEFVGAEEFAESDIEPLRAQLKVPGWTRIVGVRSRRFRENVEVYTLVENGEVAGLAIIAWNRPELILVNLAGPVDLVKLVRLEGHLGIPRFDLEEFGR